MNCSTPGFPVHHQLPEPTQTHVRHDSDSIQPSHPVTPISSCPQSFKVSESFPVSRLFTLGGHNIGASASEKKWRFLISIIGKQILNQDIWLKNMCINYM